MSIKTFLFGFGAGAVIVSAFLLVVFLLVPSSRASAKQPAQMTNQEIVASADNMIKEAGARGVEQQIDLSPISAAGGFQAGSREMSNEEIIDAAAKLGMEFPKPVVEITDVPASTAAAPAQTDTPTPVPTDTPTPVPTDTPTPVPTDTPTPAPTDTPTKAPTPTTAPAIAEHGDSVHVSIPEGLSSGGVCKLLYEAGVVEDADYFNKYILNNGMENSIRYGEYDIPKDSTAAEILRMITS